MQNRWEEKEDVDVNDDVAAYVVVAILANSSCQVGLAFMDITRPCLSLLHVNDNKNFASTFTFLEELEVKEIIVPQSHLNKQRICKLLQKWVSIRGVPEKLTLVPRGKFNEDEGLSTIKKLSGKESFLSNQGISTGYLFNAAAAALLHHVEFTHQLNFLESALKIEITQPQNHMVIDPGSVKDLELLSNKKDKSKLGTLLDLLNVTNTKVGERFLKRMILNPPYDREIINSYVAAADELSNPGMYEVTEILETKLESLHDLDLITNFYSHSPKNYTISILLREVINSIRLRDVLLVFLNLQEILQNLHSMHFVELKQLLLKAQPGFETVVNEIQGRLNLDVTYKSRPEDRKHEALMAVRRNIDGVLDLARCTYTQTMQHMRRTVQVYASQYPAKKIELCWTAQRGYHLKYKKTNSCSAKMRKYEDICEIEFIRVKELKATVRCTTQEIHACTERINIATKEILDRSLHILKGIREVIGFSQCLPTLFELSDKVATIDYILCIGSIRQIFPEWTCPEFVDPANGMLDIQSFVHPLGCVSQKLVEEAEGMSPYSQPETNSITLSLKSQKIAILTGANCSGKSTLLKAIAVLCVMGHLGFPIPAESATIPLCRRLFTRIGTEDDLEGNASTFSVEMSDLASILHNLENSSDCCSLVFIDELGRGTSPMDGAALAWATIEDFFRFRAMVVFVTHYSELLELPKQLPYLIKHYTFKFHVSNTCTDMKLINDFETSHELCEADVSTPDISSIPYGIMTAISNGFPSDVAESAMKVRHSILEMQLDQHQNFDLSMDNVDPISVFRATMCFLRTRSVDSALSFKILSNLKKRLLLEQAV